MTGATVSGPGAMACPKGPGRCPVGGGSCALSRSGHGLDDARHHSVGLVLVVGAAHVDERRAIGPHSREHVMAVRTAEPCLLPGERDRCTRAPGRRAAIPAASHRAPGQAIWMVAPAPSAV